MTDPSNDTILLVCDCEHSAADILDRLYDGGFAVIGPAQNAAMAMAMAAQTAPSVALVATPPNGRRNAGQLAHDLMRTWGVRSWVLDEASNGEAPKAAWSAGHAEIGHIRRALHGEPAEGGPA